MDPDQIERLRRPEAYPGSPGPVEIRQTHISIVCLAGDAAYKLKKSKRLPFVDFSDAERRHFFIEEELRLNRRLCPDVYLAVVPLRRLGDGRLTFREDQGGDIVDYAVRMRRLPEERMLDGVLDAGQATAADLRRIAERVVAFHREAERGPQVVEWGAPAALRDLALANFTESRAFVGPVFPAALHRALEARTRRDFERWLPVLVRRAAEGRVVDGHGDLHARNICLTDPPAIYDCLEFSPAYRCGDVATEHAFLAMDLRYRGHPELAAAYVDAVVDLSGDAEIRDLLPPLLRYRALVRAKVSAIAAGEAEIDAAERLAAAATARRYLRLAAATAIEEDGSWWLMLCGLPGSGKSGIAAALAAAAAGSWPVFSSDRIRKELAGAAPADPLPDRCYTPEFSRRTYGTLRARAAAATASGARVAILDANFRERAARDLTRASATAAGARLAILHVEAGEAIILRRLDWRAGNPSAESDANREVYRRLKSVHQAPGAGEADRLLALDGAASAEEACDTALAALLET